MPTGPICISLGSNMGEPEANLARAREALAATPGLALEALSPVYLTEPQNLRGQPWFANQAACLRCDPALGPEAVLDALLAVETRLGRVRQADPALRYGPRVIDLDLLLFGNVTLQTLRLTLPHPRLQERAFVLVPLRDILPDLVLPDGRGINEVLRALPHAVEGNRITQ